MSASKMSAGKATGFTYTQMAVSSKMREMLEDADAREAASFAGL